MRKRIFSGAQPTGSLHIGSYLAELKNWDMYRGRL